MADLRLAAIAAIAAVAGCGRAGAAPEGAPAIAVTVPPGWQAMPELAAQVKAALGARATVDACDAWGEPARGCFAVAIALPGAGTAAAIGAEIVRGFEAAGSGSASPPLVVRDVAPPDGDEGTLALGFERGDYRGRLRARLGGGRIAALACFANGRERAACEAACNGLLGAVQ